MTAPLQKHTHTKKEKRSETEHSAPWQLHQLSALRWLQSMRRAAVVLCMLMMRWWYGNSYSTWTDVQWWGRVQLGVTTETHACLQFILPAKTVCLDLLSWIRWLCYQLNLRPEKGQKQLYFYNLQIYLVMSYKYFILPLLVRVDCDYFIS